MFGVFPALAVITAIVLRDPRAPGFGYSGLAALKGQLVLGPRTQLRVAGTWPRGQRPQWMLPPMWMSVRTVALEVWRASQSSMPSFPSPVRHSKT